MTKYNEFNDSVREAVIIAVRLGGYSNVYITSNLNTIVTNASKAYLESEGTNIVYTIDCKSYGDLGYEEPGDFIEADADYCYMDNIQEDLLSIYIAGTKDDKLTSILDAAKNLFEENQCENKILTWTCVNNNVEHKIYELDTFIDFIKNRFDIELQNVTDAEAYEAFNLDVLLSIIDGYTEYYNPIEKIEDPAYKYCYHIIFIIHQGTPYKYELTHKIFSDIEIPNKAAMGEILVANGVSIPGEFGVEWANHCIVEVHETDLDNLYKYAEVDDAEVIRVS
jgi:hypothetical protein